MINVTLSQVLAFERVVRLGTVHAAAEDLGLSQPAVSQRIRELEQTLGAKLFVRNGRRITVSADGTAMLAYADQLLKTTDEMVLRLRSHDPGNRRGTEKLWRRRTWRDTKPRPASA